MTLDLATIDPALLKARPAKEGKNILTPICRISFPTLYNPKAAGKNPKPEDKKKFSCSLLIPSQCDITLLKKMAGDAAMEKWGEKVKEMKIKSPFLQAGDHKYEGYVPGWWLLRPSSESKPTVVTSKGGSLVVLKDEDAEEVYPGRWATVSLNAFPYDVNGNKGVAFGLNNIMLLHHDDSLGGRMRAEDEFEAVPGVADTNTGAPAVGTIDNLF